MATRYSGISSENFTEAATTTTETEYNNNYNVFSDKRQYRIEPGLRDKPRYL